MINKKRVQQKERNYKKELNRNVDLNTTMIAILKNETENFKNTLDQAN